MEDGENNKCEKNVNGSASQVDVGAPQMNAVALQVDVVPPQMYTRIRHESKGTTRDMILGKKQMNQTILFEKFQTSQRD